MRDRSTSKAIMPIAVKSVVWSTIFVAANTLLPQLFHSVALSGQQFLPIMLFTIVAAILFGVKAGVATAILSPLVSMLIFDMPSSAMTSILIVKGVAAAAVIGYGAYRVGRVSIYTLVASVAAYQVVGFVVSSLVFNMSQAVDMLLISWPAVILQLVVGYVVIKKIAK